MVSKLRANLLGYAGILSKREAHKIEKRIKESRKASIKRINRIRREIRN